MPLSLVTPIASEPVTWAMAQKQLRLDGVEDDKAFVETVIIPAARDRCELATGRAMVAQTWDLVLDEFPREGYIEIPKPPLVSVTYVHYVDTAGVTQTWAAGNYLVQTPAGQRCRRGRVALPFASVWPITLRQMGAVTVRFVAGYATVPPLLVSGMLMDAGALYENREAVVVDDRRVSAVDVPGGTRAIYWSYRSHATQGV